MAELPKALSQETPAVVERMTLELKMDATITVHDPTGAATDWLKPGTKASVTWRGVPSEQEVVLRYKDLNQMVSVTLEDVIVSTRKRIDEGRRGR